MLFLWLWRIIAIFATLATFVGVAIVLLIQPINYPLLIALYAVGYLLSLSTLIRAIYRRNMYSGGAKLALLYFLAIILNAVLAPVTLFISVFGRTFRLINYNTFMLPYDEESPAISKRLAKQELKAEIKELRTAQKLAAKELAEKMREERRLAKKGGIVPELEPDAPKEKTKKISKKKANYDLISSEVSDKIRASLWRTSANRAVKKILDESYKGDIKIDDGIEPKIYKQVALINLSHQKYALLAEKDEHGRPASVANAFAIVPDARYGNSLVLVEDDALRERIFAVYRALLAEKRIYSA